MFSIVHMSSSSSLRLLLVCAFLTDVVVSSVAEQTVQKSPSPAIRSLFCSEQIVSTCCDRPVIPEPCTIDLASYGYDDSTKHGFVRTSKGSWDVTYAPEQIDRYRGVTLFELDPRTCTTRKRQRFDTYASANDRVRLLNTLEWAATGTIVIGVSADSAEDITQFQSTLGPFFAQYHMNLYGLQTRDKLAFILQKGYPRKTVFERKPRYGESLRMRIVVHGSNTWDYTFSKV